MEEKLIINKEILLQRFPGKGGWTYASIPVKLPKTKNKFSWRKVRGKIDNFEINDFRLMPMGDGTIFLPIKFSIRKVIKKEAGDYVKIILYEDKSVYQVPQYILDCISMESQVIQNKFAALSESKQREYSKYIESVKSEDARAKRILWMIKQLETLI